MPEVFISYAREDADRWLQPLLTHLTPFMRRAPDAVWWDASIRTGDQWEADIATALESAAVALLLVTKNFLASDYIVQKELPYLLSARQSRGVRLLPVLLESCDLSDFDELNGLQWMYGKQSLSRLSAADLDDAFVEICKAIRTEVDAARKAASSGIVVSTRTAGTLSGDTAKELTPAQPELRVRTVGISPVNAAPIFKDRVQQQAEIARLLADSTARMISVLGRAGIGKTATAEAVLARLETASIAPAPELGPLRGIAYIDQRTAPLSFAKLYRECADLLDKDRADNLMHLFYDAAAPPEYKAAELFRSFAEGQYVASLDHVDPMLDSEGHIQDPEIAKFFEIFLRASTRLRLVITSRIPIDLPVGVKHCDKRVWIEDGLGVEDAVALLRDLDPYGSLGEADEGELREAAERVHGVPHALWRIAGLMAGRKDVFPNVRDVLESFYDTEQLVEGSYRYLAEDARRVLDALAIFNRQVPPAAIDFLLEPFVPATRARSGLVKLDRARLAKVNRKEKLVWIHPVDRDYALSRIPLEGEYGQRALHQRAAIYYRKLRETSPPQGSIEMEEAELHHLLEAQDYPAAAILLERISEALNFGGQPQKLLEIATMLEAKVTGEDERLSVIASLAHARTMLGPLDTAARYLERELELRIARRELERAADVARRLGNVLRYQLRAEEAIERFRQAQDLLRSAGDREGAMRLLYNLGLAAVTLGDFETAERYSAEYIAFTKGGADARASADALSLAGVVALRRGASSTAIARFREALELYEEFKQAGGIPHNREIYALNSLGLSYLEAGMADLAIRYLAKGQEIANGTYRARVEAFCCFNLAFAYLHQKQFEQASASADRALTILCAFGLPEGPAAGRLQEAMGALKEKNVDEVCRALLDAAELVANNFDLVSRRFVEAYLKSENGSLWTRASSRDTSYE